MDQHAVFVVVVKRGMQNQHNSNGAPIHGPHRSPPRGAGLGGHPTDEQGFRVVQVAGCQGPVNMQTGREPETGNGATSQATQKPGVKGPVAHRMIWI